MTEKFGNLKIGEVIIRPNIKVSNITDPENLPQGALPPKATTSADGLMAKEDKVKLNGIEAGANKFTHPTYTPRTSDLNKVTVDATGHVSAVVKVVKADITALGIPSQDTTYSNATTTTNGLMSKEDKIKLNAMITFEEV